MAFVRKGKGSSWELRQSAQTPVGPRSKTLATFTVLTPEAIDHAISRSAGPLTADQVVRAARRAGAPVAESPVDRAARELLRELNAGARPRSVFGRLIEDKLAAPATQAGLAPPSAAQQSAAEWVGATPADRAAALVDLLLLTDALPAPRAKREARFPRFKPVAP